MMYGPVDCPRRDGNLQQGERQKSSIMACGIGALFTYSKLLGRLALSDGSRQLDDKDVGSKSLDEQRLQHSS